MLRKPSLAGLVIGILFMAGSLIPALLPRPWFVQGAVSGMALAVGYGVGTGITVVWRRFTTTPRHRARSRPRPHLAAAIPLAVLGWALVVHLRWQTDIRRLMDMDPGAWGNVAAAMATALPVGILIVLASRAILALIRRFLSMLQRALPRGLAVAMTSVTALTLVLLFFDLVVASRLVPALEEAHATSDRSFDPAVEPPTSPALAGGPGSLIDWAQMGRQGRVFVAETPSQAELEDFSGEPATEPIRVYVGLEIAATAEGRAVRAIEEMERSGAFQREVIVLVTPTGSGWIDPYAIEPLEYMYNGETAAVAVQYSYLASWMVMLRNQDLATEASQALYRVVSQRLAEEPESTRPKLLLYGESLGAFGWERIFDGLADVTTGADGVLWVGPPRVNPIWRGLVAARDPGSPLWRPVFERGETVRFGPDRESLLAPDGEWSPPRIVYLQHSSDPITWLSLDLFTKRPEWLDPPRGTDVSRHTPYVPVVTYLQMAVDLAMGTNAPIGHGHKFGLAQADAWSLILPPPGWTIADTDALLDRLEP